MAREAIPSLTVLGPPDVASQFGARLRELRQAKGLTQQDLATRADMTQIGIAQLEAGRRRPMWESVIALAKALGVGCEAFMTAAEEHDKPKPGRPPKRKPDDSDPAEARAAAPHLDGAASAPPRKAASKVAPPAAKKSARPAARQKGKR